MPSFPIRIPKTSLAMTEATLVECLVAEGGSVAEGQPLYTIETEKVEQEIEAPASGVVHWAAEPGTTYEVGTEVGQIDGDG